MLEVKAPLAALAGVLAFMGSAEAMKICPCLLGSGLRPKAPVKLRDLLQHVLTALMHLIPELRRR